MENAINNIATIIGSLITIGGAFTLIMNKIMDKKFEPLNKNIRTLDFNNSKCFLVNFLTDVENGMKKDEVQIKLAYEIYDHYTKELNGNSYVHDKWEKLMK